MAREHVRWMELPQDSVTAVQFYGSIARRQVTCLLNDTSSLNETGSVLYVEVESVMVVVLHNV
jgi:hypothetical protein